MKTTPGPATSAPEGPVAPRGRQILRSIPPACYWLGAVTLLAVFLQFLPYPEGTVVPRSVSLKDYFPGEMNGWKSEDLPLAETEDVQERVGKILGFDDALLRSFTKGGKAFTLYVAFWKSGKMPSREIAFHIPDRCWPTAGWVRTAAKYDQRIQVGDKLLAPAQYREFQFKNQQHQNVLYWHIFDGRVIVYSRDKGPASITIFTDLLKRGVHQRGEQYFIRIASEGTLDSLMEDEGFKEILELLAPLGPGLSSVVEQF